MLFGQRSKDYNDSSRVGLLWQRNLVCMSYVFPDAGKEVQLDVIARRPNQIASRGQSMKNILKSKRSF